MTEEKSPRMTEKKKPEDDKKEKITVMPDLIGHPAMTLSLKKRPIFCRKIMYNRKVFLLQKALFYGIL